MSKKKNKYFIREHNSLFKPDKDWQNNACLNVSHDNWPAYIEGYKQAADIIVNYVVSTNKDQDFLVYPTAFLYRQYIELLLKKIIVDGKSLLDEDARITEGHSLGKLWEKCREILETIWPDEDKTILDNIKCTITDFENIDPSSTAFRYPVDREENPSLPGIIHINLRNMSDKITATVSLLNGAYLGISDLLQSKREMEYEMSTYYDFDDYY